jgi:DNA-binding NarL/FixJ family response regulator
MLYVAIVEDNKKAGRILREYIDGGDIKVTAVYTSGEEALKTIPTLPLPDVILMDIGLGGLSGIEVTRQLKDRYPEMEIVIQTVFEDTATIIEAIKAGASGYLLKASSREDILRALQEVKRGSSFLTGTIARKVLKDFQRPREQPAAPIRTSEFSLTGREEEILKALTRGLQNKEIAEQLGISAHTVNNHIRRIYEKLRVHSRGEAVARAIAAATSVPEPGAE